MHKYLSTNQAKIRESKMKYTLMQMGYYLQSEGLCSTKSIFHAVPAFLLSLNRLPREVV